jgi:hypothetical protein
VAGGFVRIHDIENGVRIAVYEYLMNRLDVAGFLAFHPEFVP